MTARLLVLDAQGSRIVPLGLDPVTVGRETSGGPAHLELSGHNVSRRHCRLESAPGGGHRAVDLLSTNGCWLNDHRFVAVELTPFDRLRLGDATLVYLDLRTDPHKVLALLGRSDSETETGYLVGRSLRDDLLGLLLDHQDLDGGAIQPLIQASLGRLRRVMDSSFVSLLVRSNGEATDMWFPSVGSEEGGEPALALEECLGWVEEAEAAKSVICKQTLGGPLLVVPITYLPCLRGLELRRDTDVIRAALVVQLGERDVGAEEEVLLCAMGRQLAGALFNARLHERATVDPLTGLYNRGSLERALDHEFGRARREGGSLGLVLIDVDDFKAINDTQGHLVGDEVLRSLGAVLRSTLRSGDLACRWGGEEFLLVLPLTGTAGALAVAQKVVERVSASALELPVPITISAGVAAYPAHGRTVNELLTNADQALYAAKDGGKDRACLFGAGAAQPRDESTDLGKTHRLLGRPRVAVQTEPPVAWLISEMRPPIPIAGSVSLGRSEQCDIVLPFKTISRVHAVLSVTDGAVCIEDSSSNGTFVNGERVTSTGLDVGDLVEIGPFSFELAHRPSCDTDETLGADQDAGVFSRESPRAVIARLEAGRSTGTLCIPNGELVVSDGALVSASLDQLRGLQALQAIAELREGCYVFREEAIGCDTTVPGKLSELALAESTS